MTGELVAVADEHCAITGRLCATAVYETPGTTTSNLAQQNWIADVATGYAASPGGDARLPDGPAELATGCAASQRSSSRSRTGCARSATGCAVLAFAFASIGRDPPRDVAPPRRA